MNFSNISDFPVDAEEDRASLEEMKSLYTVTSSIIIGICCVSIALNLIFSLSRLWSPEKLDSNIQILYSMGIVGVFQPIVHMSYLLVQVIFPIHLQIYVQRCPALILERFHQFGYLTVATHYFALCLGHWILITKIHYENWLNDYNTKILLMVCWISPFIWVFIFSWIDGFGGDNCENFLFTKTWKTRFAYFAPVLVMFVLTTVMLIQVISAAVTSNSRGRNFSRVIKRAARTYTGFYVTFTVGLIPLAVLQIVFCQDCFFSTEEFSIQTISWTSTVTQFLQLLAMICNPVFYSWRSEPVLTGLWRMSIALILFTCRYYMSNDRVLDLESKRQLPNQIAQGEVRDSSETGPTSSHRRQCSSSLQQTSV